MAAFIRSLIEPEQMKTKLIKFANSIITEVEGKKAQESINRMSTATNEKEFLSAANDYKKELFRLKKIVADRAGAEAGAPPDTKDDPLGIR